MQQPPLGSTSLTRTLPVCLPATTIPTHTSLLHLMLQVRQRRPDSASQDDALGGRGQAVPSAPGGGGGDVEKPGSAEAEEACGLWA